MAYSNFKNPQIAQVGTSNTQVVQVGTTKHKFHKLAQRKLKLYKLATKRFPVAQLGKNMQNTSPSTTCSENRVAITLISTEKFKVKIV